MADFRTHITTSCILGAGYGAAGYYYLHQTPTTSALAAGLCGVAGMLPDLDSDSGVPVRETMSFAAALVPMLMIERWQSLGLGHESIALAGVITYVVIRFGIANLFKHYTVHRGMWHSIPAAASAGLLAFLACSCEDLNARYFKSAAVVLGFMSHLVLDEIWSVTVRGVIPIPKLKKSFGTAMKFWGDDRWANFSTYAKLVVLVVLATGDPVLMNWMGYHEKGLPTFAQKVVRQAEGAIRRTDENNNENNPEKQLDFPGWPMRR
jgi:membrane-bound metal-dependent hydrolase YbcI (DUF457 family)